MSSLSNANRFTTSRTTKAVSAFKEDGTPKTERSYYARNSHSNPVATDKLIRENTASPSSVKITSHRSSGNMPLSPQASARSIDIRTTSNQESARNQKLIENTIASNASKDDVQGKRSTLAHKISGPDMQKEIYPSTSDMNENATPEKPVVPHRDKDTAGTWTPSGLWVRTTSGEAQSKAAVDKATKCWNQEYEATLKARKSTRKKPPAQGSVSTSLLKGQAQETETQSEKKKRNESAFNQVERRYKDMKRKAAEKAKKEEEERALLAKQKAERKAKSQKEYDAWLKKNAEAAKERAAVRTQRHNEAESIRRTRNQLNSMAFKEWKMSKSKTNAKHAITQSVKVMTEAQDARRINAALASTAHFCPVPRAGALGGGYCTITKCGANGWRPPDRGEPSRQRWLYGGRLAAGCSGADSWEYS